jgi:hypothetical protein
MCNSSSSTLILKTGYNQEGAVLKAYFSVRGAIIITAPPLSLEMKKMRDNTY